MANLLPKRAWSEFSKLKGLNLNSTSSIKFIVDSSPFDNDESPIENYSFIGRILPMSDPFNQSAFKIELKLPNNYPLEPPQVRILTPIHHPNVSENGSVCLPILRKTESWKASLFLDDVLKELLKIIDHPDLNIPVNNDVADEYLYNKNEYDRKALVVVQNNKLPRI